MSTHHHYYLFLLLLTLPIAAPNPPLNLPTGSHLTITDSLTSPDSTFTFGFLGGSNLSSNAYFLSIYFTSSPSTIVWTANRDRPVNGHSSRLSLRSSGLLSLTDIDGSIPFQTNTSSSPASLLRLLDSGNLVLLGTSGRVIWQSFDSPTDTLLPTQPLTRSTRLVSNVGPGLDLGSGAFALFFDNDNVVRLIYNGPQITSIYWPYPLGWTPFQLGRTTYNSNRIVVLDDNGLVTSSDQLTIRASDMNTPGVRRYLKMDYDGNLRIYSLTNKSPPHITYQAVGSSCLIHGLCGVNGICIYTPNHACSCPPGYTMTNTTDWSQGCKPLFNTTCDPRSVFVKLTNTDYYGFDLNYTTGVTNFDQCRDICLGDCRCLGFSYRDTGEAFCFTKSALYNGYSSPDFPGSIYVRLPRGFGGIGDEAAVAVLNGSGVECSIGGNVVGLESVFETPNERTKWVYLYSFASALGVIEVVVLGCGWFLLFGRHGIPASLEDGYRAISSQFRSFNYGELKRATSGFKEVLGRGGFGVVYKGGLEDGRVVAVKRLGNVLGEDEFWAEVSTIGKVNHMNLVRMWGFCSQKKHRLLVYEYVENGSLDRHLFSPDSVLGWKERLRVASGTARGLAYLHHECLEWIIHCDVKPENILLDAEFDPKISDFGLAKLSQRGGPAGSRVTRIRGTKGYMAPEWAMNLPLTAKVDVYSYGVVILELVRGIRLCDLAEDQESELARLERVARARIELDGGDLVLTDGIVDPRLEGKFSRKQAATMIRIGVSCLCEDRNKRPTMESVAQLLLECEDSEG